MSTQCAWLGAVLAALLTAACGAAAEGVRPNDASGIPWWQKVVWTEKDADSTRIMVTGRTGNASLDEGMAIDNATQDAREQLALYLDAATVAFRERLRAQISAAGKKGDAAVGGAAEKTETDKAGGRTIADAAVRGMEVVSSRVDEDKDTLYVLAQLDVGALRSAMATSAALSEAERVRIESDAQNVRQLMDEALSDARATKH